VHPLPALLLLSNMWANWQQSTSQQIEMQNNLSCVKWQVQLHVMPVMHALRMLQM
jgi:hypothetical protein